MKIVHTILISLMICVTAVAQEQVRVWGQIWEEGEQGILIGAELTFIQNGIPITGTHTNLDGDFNIWLNAGVYDLQLNYNNCPVKLIKNIVAETNLPEPLKIIYTSCKDTPPIIVDPITGGNTITAEQIRGLPRKVAKLSMESPIIPDYSFTLSDPPVSIKKDKASTSAVTTDWFRHQSVKAIKDFMFYFPGLSISQ